MNIKANINWKVLNIRFLSFISRRKRLFNICGQNWEENFFTSNVFQEVTLKTLILCFENKCLNLSWNIENLELLLRLEYIKSFFTFLINIWAFFFVWRENPRWQCCNRWKLNIGHFPQKATEILKSFVLMPIEGYEIIIYFSSSRWKKK